MSKVLKMDIDPEGIIIHVWRHKNGDNTPDEGMVVNPKYETLHAHMQANRGFYRDNYIFDDESYTFIHGPHLPKLPKDFILRDGRPVKPDGKRECTMLCCDLDADGNPLRNERAERIRAQRFEEGKPKHGDYD